MSMRTLKDMFDSVLELGPMSQVGGTVGCAAMGSPGV